MRALASFLAATAVLSAAPAWAQTRPPADEETEVETITVTTSIENAVRSFVETVGTAPRDRNLARWDGRVCVGVVNMTPRFAQALVDHVSAVSLAVGLQPGDPGCRADILILADSNGDGLAQWLVDGDPLIFRPDIGNTNLGTAALERFQHSGLPVRWWHVTQTVHAETGEIATGGATITVRGGSRLRQNVSEEMKHVIIILDTSRIGTISFASLADYVAMVALAQVDAQADVTGYDTVLNLFQEGGNANGRMTDWDLEYLRALYSSRGDAANPGRQTREIAADVLRERTAEENAQAQAEAED